jgi:hypothetical protein
MKNVLDLAREGVIDYQRQYSGSTVLWPNSTAPIRPVNFGSNTYRHTITAGDDWVSFPEGSRYIPVSYEIGTMYISSTTLYPEACYRWMRKLSQNPHLFFGLPAYRSRIDGIDPAVTSGIAFMQNYVKLLEAENVIFFPPIPPFSHEFEQIWLYTAFDRYVLEDGDLEAELQIAEGMVRDLRACLDPIPPLADRTSEEINRFYSAQARCIVGVDPSFSDRVGWLIE